MTNSLTDADGFALNPQQNSKGNILVFGNNVARVKYSVITVDAPTPLI